MTARSLVVQAPSFDSEVEELDRWFDAVGAALAQARSERMLGRWRILAGGSLGGGAVSAFRARAKELGGDFTWTDFDRGMSEPARHRQLLAGGDDDLVLVVDADCIILASTLARLMSALDGYGSAAAARTLPLDFATRVTHGCVLFSRESLGLPDVADLGSSAPVTECPEAVVFRRSARFSGEDRSTDDPNAETIVPPLLTELVSVSSLADIGLDLGHALAPDSIPLLTIIMRTQVRRAEALREALLCLGGQSDGRFELLVVAHDAQENVADRILDDQPPWLRSRARVVVANGGTRSHPLNVGIELARGSHLAFFDDDDLVFGHWVGTFLGGAQRHPGRVLRVVAGVQQAAAVSWSNGLLGQRAESAITTPYPSQFDLADHLRVNMTPFMAFAFPRPFFTLFGGADEQLDVCEDWDLVLRAAGVLGVADLQQVTAIYRRWSSGSDSYSLDPGIWERDMAAVMAKAEARPLVLPSGSASQLVEMSAARVASIELQDVYRSSSWRLTTPLRAISEAVRGWRKRRRGAE